MVRCKSGYDPQEDSNMLERWARQYAKGRVLDMGTGSGIQAIAAAQNPKVESVLAADIQKEVINYCKLNIKNPKIRFIHSDLFKNIKGKFDTIIFNPPYLPQELEVRDIELEGGKKGYEVVERFLDHVNGFLNTDGIILILFSSLTKKSKIEEFIRNNLLDFDELERSHMFFEDLHVYLLKKSDLLKKFEKEGIRNIKYLAKGHRGLLFTGTYHDKKIAIKIKNPGSAAIGRVENEARWLKILNKHKIAPKLVFAKEGYFAYHYISGTFIIGFIEASDKGRIRKVLKEVFNQMYTLDKLGIDKEEMHHPVKHVIVGKNKPYLVDFERAHYVEDPKNVTQFCQFMMNKRVNQLLRGKGIRIEADGMIRLAKIYKKEMSFRNFKKIMGSI